MSASRLILLLPFFLWPGFTAALSEPAVDAPQQIHMHLEQLRIAAFDRTSGVRWEEVEDLARFYESRAFAPAWSMPSRLASLIEELEALADDGLRPADYAVDALRRYHQLTDPTPEQRASVDMLATRQYLKALTHLNYGRLDPAVVEPLWRFEHPARLPDRKHVVLQALAGHGDIAAAFDRARPALAQYHALRNAFGTMRDSAMPATWPTLPRGPLLRPGAAEPRVALLRERLTMAGYDTGTAAVTDAYDDALVIAVMQFQRDHQLDPDGIVGPATLDALNVPRSMRIKQIKVNLERMRWLAGDLVGRFVLVDVAGARITYFRDREPVWSARTQVGRPARPTPLLKSEITHFTFNPTWTIPPTILRRDKLPEIRRDIDYLARNRIRVLDYSGNELAPETIDWNRPGAVLLRQDAGPENALGQVAIRFPNPYSVYLHDTPNQRLFAREHRAFSSGCVRVEHAMELVDLLLEDAGDVDSGHIAGIIESGRTRNVSLPRPVPVLMAYWTAQANGNGHVTFRPDVYDRDAVIIRALAAP